MFSKKQRRRKRCRIKKAEHLLECTGGAPSKKGAYNRPNVQSSRPLKQPASLPPVAPTAEKTKVGAAVTTSMDIIDPVETSFEQPKSIAITKADSGEKCIGTIISLGAEYGFMSVNGKTGNILFSRKVCGGLYEGIRPGDKVTCKVYVGKKGLWALKVRRVWT